MLSDSKDVKMPTVRALEHSESFVCWAKPKVIEKGCLTLMY